MWFDSFAGKQDDLHNDTGCMEISNLFSGVWWFAARNDTIWQGVARLDSFVLIPHFTALIGAEYENELENRDPVFCAVTSCPDIYVT